MKAISDTELLNKLNVSATNQSNVKSIIKKLFNGLDLEQITRHDLYDPKQVKRIIEASTSSKKWVEVMGYILKTATLLKCKYSVIETYKKYLNIYKEDYLTNYNKDREYLEDKYEDIRKLLKDNFDNEDTIKRRISKLYYYLGGMRKGELLNCKVCDVEYIKDLDQKYNYLNLSDDTLYILNHKTISSRGPRLISICKELKEELKESNNNYLIPNSQNTKPLSPNTFQKYFKAMTDINPLDYRHYHAVFNTKQSTQEQHEQANKLGHSLATSHFIYSNDLVKGKVSYNMIKDAKKHYKQLKLQKKKEKTQFIIDFD